MLNYLGVLALGYLTGYFIGSSKEKFGKISEIHSVISEHTPGFVSSWYKTVKTVAKIQYEGVYDKYIRRVKTPKYVSHELFEIDYFHKGKNYRILIKDKVKDHISINVYDSFGNDITEKFLSYFGPQYNFHNHVYTPRDLGCEKIIIIDGDLNEIIYQQDQPIRL